MLKEITIDDNENFTQEQIQRFQDDDEFYRRFVESLEKDTSGNFRMVRSDPFPPRLRLWLTYPSKMIKDGPIQAYASAKVREYMTMMLGGDEWLCKQLIPNFPIGVRRVTPAPGYLEALRKENVEVVTGSIRRFVPNGIEMDSGDVLEVDAIVCATGFDMSFCPRFSVVGREGDLRETWSNGKPEAYMSLAVKGMPNYFSESCGSDGEGYFSQPLCQWLTGNPNLAFLGPNAPIGHGSVFTLSEQIARYIVRLVKKCQVEHIRALAPRPDAVADYNEHIAAFMPRTAWAAPGRSWFKMGKEKGPVVALHPGSRVHFFHMLETMRPEDYDYVYDGEGGRAGFNRFGYLGNGFSMRELDDGGNSTWYLSQPAKI